jgi:hypothetical protein
MLMKPKMNRNVLIEALSLFATIGYTINPNSTIREYKQSEENRLAALAKAEKKRLRKQMKRLGL